MHRRNFQKKPVRSCCSPTFQQFHGKAVRPSLLLGLLSPCNAVAIPHCISLYFIVFHCVSLYFIIFHGYFMVIYVYFMGSVSRALTKDFCESLFVMPGSTMSDFALSSERKNHK